MSISLTKEFTHDCISACEQAHFSVVPVKSFNGCGYPATEQKHVGGSKDYQYSEGLRQLPLILFVLYSGLTSGFSVRNLTAGQLLDSVVLIEVGLTKLNLMHF